MRIGAALGLIAVGAILRFALVTVSIGGVYLHTVGIILMAVGVVGLILWLAVWAPWARGQNTSYQQSQAPDGGRYPPGQAPGTYARSDGRYEDGYPR